MSVKNGMVAIACTVLTALVIGLVASCQDGPGPAGGREVEFSSGCSDIVDPWTLMSLAERNEAYSELLRSKAAELEDLGFAPEACRVIGAQAEDCKPALGTRLACRYACGNGGE